VAAESTAPALDGTRALGLVRGVVAERVAVSTPLDPFLSLRALASYSSLSVRKLRDLLDDAGHPLPAYQVGGKILVRRSEFDAWMAAHRRRRDVDVETLVSEVLRDL
jgi:excisionase family DNA binding protein